MFLPGGTGRRRSRRSHRRAPADPFGHRPVDGDHGYSRGHRRHLGQGRAMRAGGDPDSGTGVSRSTRWVGG